MTDYEILSIVLDIFAIFTPLFIALVMLAYEKKQSREVIFGRINTRRLL